jgi:hypothetical protein
MLVAWACCAGTSSRKVSAASTAKPLLVTLNLKILSEELLFMRLLLCGGFINRPFILLKADVQEEQQAPF